MLYAHASRILHLESNPGNARALVQRHGTFDVWLNPPPIPLTTAEMDAIYELPYARRPHPAYGSAKIPAYQMIRFSVAIQRGCFGGCTFCSITEHEGRIIQSRSEDSVIREIETIRDTVPGFTGVVSDLGGPTANMYRLHCKSAAVESACRRPSCVFPGVCPNLNTDHAPLISLYRRARSLRGIKKVLDRLGRALRSGDRIARVRAGVGDPPHRRVSQDRARSDRRGTAVEDDEARGRGVLQVQGAVRQVLEGRPARSNISFRISSPRTPARRDTDMLELAVWLKKNGFRADQVQAFLPSPMATATAMYHSGKNPLKRIATHERGSHHPEGHRVRRLHKAFLRYHDPENWPMLREALKRMGRADLIGNGKTAPGPRLPADRDPRAGRRPAPPGSAAVSNAAHGIAQVGRSAQSRRPSKASRCPEQAWPTVEDGPEVFRRAFVLATLPAVRLKFRAV